MSEAPARHLLFPALLALASACAASPSGPEPQAGEPVTDFGAPQPIAITGYDGDAMEPFLARDGTRLFFNNRNDPADQTDIHWAERSGPDSFAYRGRVDGAALPDVLDGVPSMSEDGTFVFTSLRGVDDKRTIWRGRFAEGKLSALRPVTGSVNIERAFWVNMDSEISADGRVLVTTDSRFDPLRGRVAESNLVYAEASDDAYLRAENNAELFARINSNLLEYAAAMTRDLKTLYFTRADFEALAAGDPAGFQTLVATRTRIDAPWGVPRPIASIKGYAEAVTLSPDECSLYFHQRVDARFVIMRTTKTSCATVRKGAR
ncbi:MAG: hypothetical protein AAF707_06555 [Pseudomonadota bacterium]